MSASRPRPRGYYSQYDSTQKRLYIRGSCFRCDQYSIASMIRQRAIAPDLDAVVYMDVGFTRIVRGRVLGRLIDSSGHSWPGVSSG